MPNDEIRPHLLFTKDAVFQSEARLLEELGERLVASPEVAIVELVKNSYDADSPTCRVELDAKNRSLSITDKGHGINEFDFLNRWMRIANDLKKKDEFSRVFRRHLTGAKGIGRFAVRFLSDLLELESIAYDEKRKTKTKLVASFDWKEFSNAKDISNVKIPYSLYRMDGNAQTGTVLRIKQLRKAKEGFVYSKDVKTEILKIVSPLSGLDGGRFMQSKTGASVVSLTLLYL